MAPHLESVPNTRVQTPYLALSLYRLSYFFLWSSGYVLSEVSCRSEAWVEVAEIIDGKTNIYVED